jgi:succinate dehydrogenase / fumarate reductase membrane anchor subunit
MLAFIVFVLSHFLFEPPHSYSAWRGWALSPSVSIATAVFFAALLAHAWVGLRDVTLDYVAPRLARLATLSLIAVLLVAIAAWVVQILFLSRG